MYIRRKVFSLLNVEGEEKYFSTTDYSLLENGEARLFSKKEENEEKKSGAGKKVAVAAGATVGATAAGIAGAAKVGKKMVENANKPGLVTKEQAEKLAKRAELGKKLQKPAEKVVKAVKKVVKK